MGLKLLFNDFADVEGRIDISSVGQVGDEPGYDDPRAVVPLGDWKPISGEEAEQLRPDADTPADVVLELISQSLPVFASSEPQQRADAAAALDPLGGRWPYRHFVYTASPPGWLTTSEDTSIDRRIGLHIDNWDRLPYGSRLNSSRRLCLNFGPGSRYLLVCDRDIMEVCRVLDRAQEHHYPHTDDVRHYVAEGHPLRCLRIRLEPGQGYIAPTEILPYDGSTSGVHEWSLAAFWLG
ncbi:hypothetical protein [Rhizohabitans arisaemae]|uniref:hypothetical protein n=1 Tax=Rhizohabitans arisaemae TaxID=2720610 RepID=UPI0024B1801E|nr:hypothetical protein [Rhizohabitans arisaemae]